MDKCSSFEKDREVEAQKPVFNDKSPLPLFIKPPTEYTTAQIALIIAAYWIVSISMVYLNKVVLSNNPVSIPAPLFVSWYQCLVTLVICVVLGEIGEFTRSSGFATVLNGFPRVKFSAGTTITVLPLSAVFVGMIAFNNFCLKNVAVSFYNVARSLSIVFNVALSYIILGKPTSWLTCTTLVVVMFGFYCGVEGEIDFSFFGTLAGVISSLFVSLNSVFTAKVLPKVENDNSQLLFYNNLNACVLFLPFIGRFESQIILDNFSKFSQPSFWLCMTLSGIMGFGIGYVTVMQVKATSPLTHNISGTAKAAVQSLLAFYIWGNEATVKGIVGILMVIFGSGFYTWVQMAERQK